MDLIDKLRELSARISKQLDHISTEEATKNALILPFINALGYNVFDPTEVTPELTADVGVKKGEKVDYAILRDHKPVILFECKHHTADLGKIHASQLYRYFSVTDARFGVLTNGLIYWFYTDLEAANKMDSKPFFEFNMLDVRESAVEELKKFSKSAFDLEKILTTASELKYTREIRRIIIEQMQEPSDEFVKFIASQVYGGRMTQSVREQFAQLTKQAFKQVVNEQINERLKSALASESTPVQSSESNVQVPGGTSEEATSTDQTSNAVTTEDEMDAYYIIRAVLREIVDVKRISMRDVQSYCGIVLDDNNRKPICRLRFNATQKYLGLFDDQKEDRVPIDQIDDIYRYVGRLKNTVLRYEGAVSTKKS